MDFRFRVASITCALVLLLGVVSAFAVGDDDQDVASDGQSETEKESDGVKTDGSTTTAPGSTTSADTTTTTVPETTSSAPTTAPATTTTAATTTTTRPPQVPIGVTPTTPGTYEYDIEGCCDENGKPFSGRSKLTVPEADAQGVQAQKQSGPEGSSTTTYRFTPEGTYLESMSISAQGQTMKLSATAPLLVIPAGASQGATSSGRLKGSGLTADVTFTLVEVGADSAVAQIEADVSGTVGGICSVTGTMTSQITARRSDQLPLETTSETDVSTCLGDVKSNSLSTLRS